MNDTEMKQMVEKMYADNIDRTDKGFNEDVIMEALIESNRECDDTNGYFKVLSALNLLNSAIKESKWKHDLSYGFIKGRASELFDQWIKNPVDGIRAYYNAIEGAVFFSVHGVVFSYHRIRLSDRIKRFIKSHKNIPISWEGIRLQKIPVEVFNLAKAA